jgi:endoglucanase
MSTLRSPHRTGWRALALAIGAAVSVLSAVACGSTSTSGPTSSSTSGSNSIRTSSAALRLYTYPGNPLFAAAAQLKFNGYGTEAAELEAVAETPSGIWIAGQPGDMKLVRRVTLAAAKAHAIPVIVAYNLPDRDACGKLSAAYGPTALGYREWINQLAAAIGTGGDIVIVEPDGLPDIVRGCLSPALSSERYQLLRYAMKQLGALPHARVYLDAGNPGMITEPSRLAGPLEEAGVGYGRGFSANASNFQWTATVVTWSQQLERALGGTVGAVIDTSRNGRGPYTGPDSPQWCNPPGRAPGPAPRFDPGPAGIDAYLWIKDPGASDGSCNGGPPAGQYWPQYAAALEQQSQQL